MVIADIVVIQSNQVSMGVLSEAVKSIVDVLNGAAGHLQDSTSQLGRSLSLIEIGLGLLAVIQGERPVSLLRRALAVAAWTWIIGDFHQIGLAFMHMLVDTSSAAFGASSDIMLQPSKVLELMTKVTKPMLDKLDGMNIMAAGTLFPLALALLAIVFAYIALALSVSLSLIEFYLYLALAPLLLPFAVLGHTRFLADRAINSVIACALKLAVVTFIVGAVGPILEKLKFEPGLWNILTWRSIWALLVTVGLAAALAMWAPRLAAGFLHSSPSLSGTAVVAMAASVASDVIQSGSRFAAAAMRSGQGETVPREDKDTNPTTPTAPSDGAGISGAPPPSPPPSPIFVFFGDQQRLQSPETPQLPGGDEPMLPAGGEA